MGITSVGTPASKRSWTLGIRVNRDLTATINLLEVVRRVRLGDVKIHQRGGVRPKTSPPLFYALVMGKTTRTGSVVLGLLCYVELPLSSLSET